MKISIELVRTNDYQAISLDDSLELFGNDVFKISDKKTTAFVSTGFIHTQQHAIRQGRLDFDLLRHLPMHTEHFYESAGYTI